MSLFHPQPRQPEQIIARPRTLRVVGAPGVDDVTLIATDGEQEVHLTMDIVHLMDDMRAALDNIDRLLTIGRHRDTRQPMSTAGDEEIEHS